MVYAALLLGEELEKKDLLHNLEELKKTDLFGHLASDKISLTPLEYVKILANAI